MPRQDDRHRVYLYFQYRNGWQCQFLEADLKTALPRKLHFTSSDKVVVLVERGDGITDSESRLMLDQAMATGRGGVFLRLTEEQYASRGMVVPRRGSIVRLLAARYSSALPPTKAGVTG